MDSGRFSGLVFGIVVILAAGAVPAESQEMVPVPEGTFTMGSDAGWEWEQPVHTVYLSQFWIDRTEVTVAAYAACLDAGGCAATPGTSDGCNWNVAGREDHPVNCLNWYAAEEYCAWAGKRLPTEAEWEKACRGTDARTYPWGEDGVTGTYPPCNSEPGTFCFYAVLDSPGGCDGCGEYSTWPVGSKPAGVSPCGAQNMGGNVREFVSDWYDEDYYELCDPQPCHNPSGPASGLNKVHRGGGWYWDGGYTARCSVRSGDHPTGGRKDYGFRCATDTAVVPIFTDGFESVDISEW
jgi:formylglycine-generating enzyme required for sulfatase activity